MNTNPYDSQDNYDSPFHRVKESETDRQIHALKTRFAEKLTEQIPAISGVELISVSHPQMSPFITIVVKLKGYRVRIQYEMDKKQFQEPYTTFDTLNFAINNGRIAGLYDADFNGQELRRRVIRIMEICYDISKIAGFGTRRGGDWINATPSFQLAEEEFLRLLTESKQTIQKEQEKANEEKKRNDDFMKRFL